MGGARGRRGRGQAGRIGARRRSGRRCDHGAPGPGRARVVAVELHPGRAALLGRRFVGVTVVQADAACMRLPGRPFRVVACPPYGITGSLLGLLLAPGSRLVAADLVLQRAVVRKLTVRGGGRGYRTAAGLTLPRRAFRPPPRVDSAVLVVRRHYGPPALRAADARGRADTRAMRARAAVIG